MLGETQLNLCIGIRLLAIINAKAKLECHAFRHIYHNHEESDTQIWLHVLDTDCSNVHIYSVDRDVGMVGLPLDFGDHKSVAIQFRRNLSKSQFLSLNSLREALLADSDLACIKSCVNNYDIYNIIQALFIASGCDFVSYFANIGKITIFKTFFQYCSFITKGDPAYPGHLHDTFVETTTNSGLLSFYRLIGCVYFSKNRASLNEFETPLQLFNSISESDIFQKHVEFLDIIRKASWNGTYEDELLPSADALKYHWLRACWVSSVWAQSLTKVFTYPDVANFGWEVKAGDSDDNPRRVEIVWDSPENITSIRDNVKHLDRGCGCKGGCKTKRCSCVKAGEECGIGCRCKKPCSNIINSTAQLVDTTDGNESVDSTEHSVIESVTIAENHESIDTADNDYESDDDDTDEEGDSDDDEGDYVSNMLELYATL